MSWSGAPRRSDLADPLRALDLEPAVVVGVGDLTGLDDDHLRGVGVFSDRLDDDGSGDGPGDGGAGERQTAGKK